MPIIVMSALSQKEKKTETFVVSVKQIQFRFRFIVTCRKEILK